MCISITNVLLEIFLKNYISESKKGISNKFTLNNLGNFNKYINTFSEIFVKYYSKRIRVNHRLLISKLQ